MVSSVLFIQVCCSELDWNCLLSFPRLLYMVALSSFINQTMTLSRTEINSSRKLEVLDLVILVTGYLLLVVSPSLFLSPVLSEEKVFFSSE